jgi:hypothetical protein
MRALSTTILLGLLLTVGVGRAVADSECIQDAKEQRGQCRTACDEDFVIAKDLCRNIDPECAAGCRVEHAACRDGVIAELGTCVDACRVQLNADRGACPKRGRGRDFCMDRAQVQAFLCRDECRDGLQVRRRLNGCRDDFRTCMTGCGIPTEPTAAPPAATPTAVQTEVPEPTAVPTEPPPPPTATRTATPKPEPTLTPVVPR